MKTATRVLSLILVFFLGFFSCIGAIIGVGYYGYAKISWDKLNEWGLIEGNNGELFSPDAKVPVNSMTLQQLVDEVLSFKNIEGGLTLNYMIDRYGVTLPEAMDEILVEELRTLPLNDIVSENGLNVLLEHVSVGTVLKFVPEGVVSEPAKETLKDKTLKQVADGDFAGLLAGVKLGYLLGVEYNLEGSVYIPVYQDPDAPTIVELLAPVDLGKMLSVVSEGGDMLEVVHEAIADVALIQLVESLMSVEEGPLFELLDGKEVGEVIVYDEEIGAYKLDFLVALSGMTIGDLLGLQPVYAENNPELLISWKDKDGNNVIGYMRGLASFNLSSLTEDDAEINDEVFLEHMYFGDLLGYVPTFDADGNIIAWDGANGEEVEPTFRKLVNKPVNDLMNGNFTVSMLMEGLFLGDLLGYTSEVVDDQKIWYEDSVEVTGLDKIVANIDLEKMLDAESDYSFIKAFEGNLMGDLLGYTKTVDGWQNGTDEVVGIDKVIANIDIEALMNPDKAYSVADAFDGALLGEVLGYDYVESKNHWYNGDEPVSVVENAISKINMGELLAGDGSYKITTAFNDTFLGDLLGYKRGEQTNTSVTIPEDKQYLWFEEVEEGGSITKKQLDGIQKELANYNLYKIMEGEQELSTEGFTVGELVGIHSEMCYVYLNGAPVMKDGERMAITVWFDSNNLRANGMLSAIAEVEIQGLDSFIKTVRIADVVDYISLDDGTTDYYSLGEVTTYIEGSTSEKRISVTKATGVMTSLAGLKVNDLSDPATVSNKVQTIKIGDVMGWYFEDGTWYTDSTKSEVASGTLGALADSKVGTINEDIKNTQIGTLLGYTKVGATWYTEYDPSTNTGTVVSGTLSAIVDFKVDELEANIQTLEVGRLLGYKKNADGKWVEVKTVGGVTTEEEITGVMATVSGFKVGTLSEQLEEMKIGTLLGWEEHDGKWYETYVAEGSSSNVLATGIMTHFASLTLDGMTNNTTVAGVIGNMTVGDALCWYLNPSNNKWYETEDSLTPIEGIMQSIAGMKVNSLNSGVNGLSIGAILEWEEHGGEWYSQYDSTNPANCVKASGIMVNLAHLKIEDLKNSSAVSNAIQDARLGEAMGWYEKDGKWYTNPECTVLATGTMASMANTPVSNLDERVKTLTVAEALGFVYNESEDVYYNNGEVVTGIMAAIADTPLTGINDKIHNTVAGELLDYVKGDAQKTDEKNTPYFSNSDSSDDIWYHLVTEEVGGVEKQVWKPCSKIQNYVANRTVNNLDGALGDLTIGDVVDYTPEDDAKLTYLIGDNWEKKSIPGFFEAVMNMTSTY